MTPSISLPPDAPAAAPSPQPARPSGLRRALDALYTGAGAVGAACIALICVLMVGQALARQVGVNTGAVNDVVSWLCAAAAFLTMAHAFKHGDFVRVTLVLEKASPKRRHQLELVSLVVAVASIAYLAFWACRFTYESWEIKEVAQGLWAVPLWIPQLSFAAGSLLFLVAVVEELVLVLTGHEPTFVRLVRERHEAGDFSSDI